MLHGKFYVGPRILDWTENLETLKIFLLVIDRTVVSTVETKEKQSKTNKHTYQQIIWVSITDGLRAAERRG